MTDPDVLRAELGRDRERRFALSLAERTPGIGSVAAPISTPTGCQP
jgi:DNA-binding IclR family transcriptional regulator